MSARISSVRVFGKNYDFIHPIKFGDNVFPFLAILDILRPHLTERDEDVGDKRLLDKYHDIIYDRCEMADPLWSFEIKDLLIIHHDYTIATDKQKFIDDFVNNPLNNVDTREMVHDVLVADPNINMYDFIRAINLKTNELCDDQVCQDEVTGSYYIDDSWTILSDGDVNYVIDHDSELCSIYGHTYVPSSDDVDV